MGETKMTIGIIEDDRLLNQALAIALKGAGYDTLCAHSKREALSLIGDSVNLLLVDIGLPDGDGVGFYREFRREKNIPAIFLTARDEERDMLAAYDTGAEDYVVKPFSMKVLLKRIDVVLKRRRQETRLFFQDLVLHTDSKQVYLKGQEILLTAKEFQLLEYFMRNQNQVLTKENILEKLWGLDGQFVVDNTVSVTVNRLRKKIEPDAGQPAYIKNVFGLGYRMGEK